MNSTDSEFVILRIKASRGIKVVVGEFQPKKAAIALANDLYEQLKLDRAQGLEPSGVALLVVAKEGVARLLHEGRIAPELRQFVEHQCGSY